MRSTKKPRIEDYATVEGYCGDVPTLGLHDATGRIIWSAP